MTTFTILERAAHIASTQPASDGRFTVAQWVGGPKPVTITYTDDPVIAPPSEDVVIALGGVIIRSSYYMALETPQSVFPDAISPTMPRPMFSVSETPPDVETDDMDVLRAGDPDWEGDDYEPRGLYDQDEWGDPIVDYDDDDDDDVVLTPVSQSLSLTIMPPTESALTANVAPDTDEDVSAEDVQMEWLSAHAPERSVETLQTLARENKRLREADTSPQRRGRGAVRPDSDVIERLLASYSKQRQAVWWWCVENAAIITHDMPSARAVGKGAGVSYETARHVLTDWRNLYGLTLTPVSD